MKILSLEILNGLADAVDGAEGNTMLVDQGKTTIAPRGRRSWHVTHSYNTVTWEVLLVLQYKGV